MYLLTIELIDDLNDSHVDFGVYLNEDFKNVLKRLNEYEQSRKENFFIFGDLKYENNAFLQQFRKIQSLNPKGLVGNSQSKIDATFNDLLRQYKAKGYDIPDLSVKNNLFEIDPLLLTEFRLHEYYGHQPKEVLENDVNMKFLEKVNEDVIKRVNNSKDNEANNADICLDINTGSEEIEKIQKEIKDTLKHNKQIKSIFEAKSNKTTQKNFTSSDKTYFDTKDTFKNNTSTIYKPLLLFIILFKKKKISIYYNHISCNIYIILFNYFKLLRLQLKQKILGIRTS